MVLLDLLIIKKYLIYSIPLIAGVTVGGAAMIYLFTIPDLIKLAALTISQVYTIGVFGVIFFSINLGGCVALFVKEVLLKEVI